MARSIKQLYGNRLAANDGEIGSVRDFYFDDQSWATRYVVAETGTWLTSQQVLLSPHAFGVFQPFEKSLSVDLSRKQIEDSPTIEWYRPVSRQFEEEYHRYYGWPNYWEGDGLWGGMRSLPILELTERVPPNAAAWAKKRKGADAHLRSTQVIRGYQLRASNGNIGHICDFMMDEESWAIDELVIKTGNRFSGDEVLIPVHKISRISCDDSTVFVNMTREAVAHSPAAQLALEGAFA